MRNGGMQILENRERLNDWEADRQIMQIGRGRRRGGASDQLPTIQEEGECRARIGDFWKSNLDMGDRGDPVRFWNNECSGRINAKRKFGKSTKWRLFDLEFRRADIEIPSDTEIHVSMAGKIHQTLNNEGESAVSRDLSILEYLASGIECGNAGSWKRNTPTLFGIRM